MTSPSIFGPGGSGRRLPTPDLGWARFEIGVASAWVRPLRVSGHLDRTLKETLVRFFTTKKALAAIAAGAVALAGAGVAYAFWSASGSGYGSATAYSAVAITGTATASPSAARSLYPGGPA